MLRTARGLALAQEALGPRAIRKVQGADAERRRNAGDEAAKALCRHRPHFGLDGVARARCDAHQARPLRRTARQCVEFVARLRLDGAQEHAAREADLEKHLNSGQGAEKKDTEREKAKEAALKRLEEEARKPAAERRPPEFGSEKDFQLIQALNKLKGRPVLVSKTQVERKEEVKEN